MPAGTQAADADDAPDGERRSRSRSSAGPNVGKSTLVNTLLGEERVIAFDEPGTTRDSIYLDFERDGRRYTLIDTAGVRRRGKVFEAVEKFSVHQDAAGDRGRQRRGPAARRRSTAITEQDAHLAGYILEAGRALVVGVNKWDARRRRPRATTSSASSSASSASSTFAAPALHLGAGRHAAWTRCCDRSTRAYAAAMAKLPTPQADARAAARRRSGSSRRAPAWCGPKLRYAHQGGRIRR